MNANVLTVPRRVLPAAMTYVLKYHIERECSMRKKSTLYNNVRFQQSNSPTTEKLAMSNKAVVSFMFCYCVELISSVVSCLILSDDSRCVLFV